MAMIVGLQHDLLDLCTWRLYCGLGMVNGIVVIGRGEVHHYDLGRSTEVRLSLLHGVETYNRVAKVINGRTKSGVGSGFALFLRYVLCFPLSFRLFTFELLFL